MLLRSLVLVCALMMLAGAAFAQDQMPTQTQNQTICVPAPAGQTAAVCSSDAETFNQNFITTYFGLCAADVQTLRQKYDWCTVYFIANIASKTGRPASEIAAMVDQGMSWNDIACRYNLTVADLRQPAMSSTMLASGAQGGVIMPVGAGPGMALPGPRTGTWISDAYGNVVLTEREDRRLKKMGYTWQDIAVATNISMVTGEPVYEVLQWTDRGMTWNQVSREYGIDPCGANVLDISCYPFQRDNTLAAPTCPQPCPPAEPVGAGPTTCPPADLSCPPTPESTCPPAVPQSPCPPADQPCPTTCPPAEQAPACPPASSPNTPSTY